jgi:hypothetical protein
MNQIGLPPSYTGKNPGRKQTGWSMGHYILPGGLFDLAADVLLYEGFTLTWQPQSSITRVGQHWQEPPLR